MKFALLGLAAFGLLAGCVSTPADPVMLTGKDAGKELSLSPGQTVKVTLVSNPTTGYDWYFSSGNPEVLCLKKSSFQPPEDRTLCGAPGHSVQDFQALKPGKCIITGKYMRHWEKTTPPAKIFQLNVTVRKE